MPDCSKEMQNAFVILMHRLGLKEIVISPDEINSVLVDYPEGFPSVLSVNDGDVLHLRLISQTEVVDLLYDGPLQ